MTSDGHAYARFRRALDAGSVTAALSSASELQHVGLVESLELCLLLCAKDSERYGRAAVRWHSRFCREVRDVELDEALAVLAALGALRGRRCAPAAHAFAELLHHRGLERAAEALIAWARRSDATK